MNYVNTQDPAVTAEMKAADLAPLPWSQEWSRLFSTLTSRERFCIESSYSGPIPYQAIVDVIARREP